MTKYDEVKSVDRIALALLLLGVLGFLGILWWAGVIPNIIAGL